MPPPRDVKKSTNLTDDDKRVLANRYRVEKKLGSGNFGTAFLVTDLKEPDELKVLKEVSIGDMEPDESIESVHEANLLSKLNNPYILKYYDSFLDGEYFCIVTEYCEGGDLDIRFKQLKKENKRLSEEQVLDWTVQLLSAVNYMHSRRVLHRDLKARNIFLKNEIIKIGDFGISRILQGTMDMASTFTGTPYYMSPEVLKHEGYNSKSDVWSIGCLLYEMCTLQHAFEGQGLMGVMYKIVEGKVPELPNTYSKELNLILKKIFRKDPNPRPSCSELLKEPYIENHVKKMIKRLEANKLIDADSTIMVKNDRNEIAKALNSKISLKDLQKQSNVKSTPLVNPLLRKEEKQTYNNDDDDDDSDIRSGINQPVTAQRPKTTSNYQQSSKELTPKERMLLNKLKKADEEAAKVGQIAKENYEERMMRETFRREATIHGSIHNRYPSTQKEYESTLKNSIPSSILKHHFSEPNFDQSNNNNNNAYSQDFENDDDEEGTILKTVQSYQPEINMTRKVVFNPKIVDDSRPIKPLKTKIENYFNEDGIPIDPELTNEYYQSFNDFEQDSSPERKPVTSNYSNFASTSSSLNSNTRNSLSKTIVPSSRRKVATAGPLRKPIPTKTNPSQKTSIIPSKTISGAEPRQSYATRIEYEQLIDYMQNAILNDKLESSETFGDDSKTSVFGINARNTKIQNLRAQAMRRLGLDTFEKCYKYLREQRSNKEQDENKIFEGLKKYTSNPNDCFIIDQLLFLEMS